MISGLPPDSSETSLVSSSRDYAIEDLEVFKQELDWSAYNLLRVLSNLIVYFGKEDLGCRMVYAVDFDILHAYMFPSQQKDNPVMSVLPTFVLEHSDEAILLPPGTVNELLEFVRRSYPIYAKIKMLFDKEGVSHISNRTFAQIVDFYNTLGHRQQYTFGEKDRDIYAIYDHLCGYLNGFKRLNHLVARGRVSVFCDYFPGLDKYYDEEIVDRLHGELQGRQSDHPRDRNDYRDAQNLATVISADAQLRLADRRGYFSPGKACIVTLLTNTKRLLSKEVVRDYGYDFIAQDKMDVLRSHVDNGRSSWLTRPLLEAALSCAFKQTYKTPRERLFVANDLFCRLAEKRNDIFRLERERSLMRLLEEKGGAGTRAKDGNDLKKEYEQRLRELAGTNLYTYFRQILSRYACEAKCHQHFMKDLETEIPPDIFCGHIFDRIKPRVYTEDEKRSLRTLFKAFDVRSSVRTVNSLFPAQVWVAKCIATEEKIIEVFRRSDSLSVYWEHRLDGEQIVALLNGIVSFLRNRGTKWQILATYVDELQTQTDEGPSRHSRDLPRELSHLDGTDEIVATSVKAVHAFSLEQIVKECRTQHGHVWRVWPTVLSLITPSANFLIELPSSGNANGTQVISHVNRDAPNEDIVRQLLHRSHVWHWAGSGILDELLRCIMQFFVSGEINGF